jgi:hypothetical protein
MFDIDGTFIESYDFDSECFTEAAKEITNLEIDTDWARYKHVTDTGILKEFFNENNIENTNEITNKITKNIKCVFLEKIKTRIDDQPINEIKGASKFITKLKEFDDVVISFAT